MALSKYSNGSQNVLLGNVFFPQTFQQRSMMTPEQVVTNFHLFPMQKLPSMFLDSTHTSTSSYSSSNTSQSPKNDRNRTSPDRKPSSDDEFSSRSGSNGSSRLRFSIESILGLDDRKNKGPVVLSNSSSDIERTPERVNTIARTHYLRRTVFSQRQRKELEVEFQAQKYINRSTKKALAERLGLSESQIKIWFQNRRMKWRNDRARQVNIDES